MYGTLYLELALLDVNIRCFFFAFFPALGGIYQYDIFTDIFI